MEVVKLSECPKYRNNPFHDGTLASLELRKFPIYPQGPMLNRETGEIITGSIYLKRVYGYMDVEPSVKVFKNAAHVLLNMTGPGVKMFFYVVSQLAKGMDKVYIAPTSALKFTGYSSNKDVYKGIAELIAMRVIAKSDESLMYYVNPNLVFAGNKADLIKDEDGVPKKEK